MSTTTPGPWTIKAATVRVDGALDHAIVADGQCIAETFGRSGETRYHDSEANARLIAAAPELLACLRRMCGMYGAYSRRLAPLLAEDEGTIWTFENANALALEAIAKAKGGISAADESKR